MKSLLNLILIVIVSLFAVHEMDAMLQAEWRLLPIFSDMPDEQARDAFLWLHIPLFAVLLWALFVANWKLLAARLACVAVIVHAIAHFVLSGHELYSFSAPIETVTVYGAAMLSFLYLVLSYRVTSA